MSNSNIYLLPLYANPKNLHEERTSTQHTTALAYPGEGTNISLSETNSLVEDRYCLSFQSSMFIVDGTAAKEAMIHHHPGKHRWKHLQFKLSSQRIKIRINLEPLDAEDYKRCIKGFLYTSRLLIEEQDIALISYFFNDKIETLALDRLFLLGKVKQAFERGELLDVSDKPITKEELDDLRQDQHLLPFLEW